MCAAKAAGMSRLKLFTSLQSLESPVSNTQPIALIMMHAGMYVVACPDRRQELEPFQAETPHIAHPSLEAFDKSEWNFVSTD